ncbi:MAG: SH3 domain-containing protein [Chloroflexi bacterium]|nr:SH3 domain-containing protein [Chloroflexota bacterium]MCI0580466.1 SH3 domain-containing protein [Chloroflexota bacterium]MCI0649210.1 SH3 domain-containing protein [Chloroflexota bacterium]MCI0727978.1 SH3 domain-containing protein [Chloroflexota bacterium]
MIFFLDIFLPILAGLAVLMGFFFIIQGILARSGITHQAYGVGRIESRQEMLMAFSRGVAALIVGLILFSVYSLSPRPEVNAPLATATRPASLATDSASTPLPTNTFAVQFEPTRTPSPAVTPPEIATPTATATTHPRTAVVNSPNGLWLREAPGGTQEVELIPDGATLILLPGFEQVNDLDWQQVRTPAGNEGWVAADFLIYQE